MIDALHSKFDVNSDIDLIWKARKLGYLPELSVIEPESITQIRQVFIENPGNPAIRFVRII